MNRESDAVGQSGRKAYQFAELSPQTLQEVNALEQRLSEETGEAVTLIAYTRRGPEAAGAGE